MGLIIKWLFGLIAIVIVALAGFGFYLTTLNADPAQKPERQMREVWANYPFDSHYVDVNGARMHYIDEGDPDGPVFLFLHGNPTSSYLWRAVLPPVADMGARAIAVDLIGFGASDRPDIGYTFVEHADYIEGFIEALELEDITFVIHDWGSALGFDYAYRNPDNVRAVAFMESIHRIPSLAAMSDRARPLFKMFRTPGVGELVVMGRNFFVENVIPLAVFRELSEEEMAAYREPFPTFGSRLPTLVWPRQIPFDGKPEEVAARVAPYAEWLPTSSVPKLLLVFEPGALVSVEEAEEIAATWSNTEARYIGAGGHYVQEDHGPQIGAVIVEWWTETVAAADDETPADEITEN